MSRCEDLMFGKVADAIAHDHIDREFCTPVCCVGMFRRIADRQNGIFDRMGATGGLSMP